MPATDRGSGRRGGRSRLVAAALLAAGCSEASPSPEPAPTEDALHDELVASDFEGEDALGGLGYVDFGEVADEPRLLGLEAIGRALARLERSGVVLPKLLPGGLRVLHREGEACGATPPIPNVEGGEGGGLTMRRLPGVVVTDLRDGFAAGAASQPSQRARESVAWCASELENLLRTDAEREALALGLSQRPG